MKKTIVASILAASTLFAGTASAAIDAEIPLIFSEEVTSVCGIDAGAGGASDGFITFSDTLDRTVTAGDSAAFELITNKAGSTVDLAVGTVSTDGTVLNGTEDITFNYAMGTEPGVANTGWTEMAPSSTVTGLTPDTFYAHATVRDHSTSDVPQGTAGVETTLTASCR